MKGKVFVQYADGTSTTVEVEDGYTIEDIARLAGLVSGKISLNGEPADADTPVDAQDIVEEQKSARGN
ncbi:hypothetical protein ES705_46412 [subsurface metagenome]